MLDNEAIWAASESSESPNPNPAHGTKMAGAGPGVPSSDPLV